MQTEGTFTLMPQTRTAKTKESDANQKKNVINFLSGITLPKY